MRAYLSHYLQVWILGVLLNALELAGTAGTRGTRESSFFLKKKALSIRGDVFCRANRTLNQCEPFTHDW